MIKFLVPGKPATKGSTRSFAHAKTGSIVTMAANPRTKTWQAAVAYHAMQAGVKRAPKGVAVSVGACFVFTRPASHFGTGRNAAQLKLSAPQWPVTRACGDVDKLLRCLLDGLDSVAYEDDSQVCMTVASKRYQVGEEPLGAWVTVDGGAE